MLETIKLQTASLLDTSVHHMQHGCHKPTSVPHGHPCMMRWAMNQRSDTTALALHSQMWKIPRSNSRRREARHRGQRRHPWHPTEMAPRRLSSVCSTSLYTVVAHNEMQSSGGSQQLCCLRRQSEVERLLLQDEQIESTLGGGRSQRQ